MAFVVGELVAPVSLDPKPFEKGLGETKKKGENWAKDMGKSWSKAGEGIEKVGKKWTTGVTLPIVGAGAAVIATAANFESSMNRVRGLTGAAGGDFEKLRDQARELGATTQYSASEAADGMGFLAMAGFKTNEILGAMPSVLELAASAQMDLASAADITSNILTGYGKDVSELGHVNDVLVKAMTSANVDLNMLGESLKYVGPVASGVGMDFEEVAAAVGLMGNAGIQGCYDGETDVLTKDGWKPWPAVTTEDEFATYNADTGEMEYQNATRLIQYRHTGKMYRVANLHIDLMVTPDHRMWVKRRGRENYEVLRAHELAGKTARYRAGGIKWKGADPQTYRVSGFEQDRASWVKNVPAVGIDAEVWATFLGWYISEGSCDYRDGNYRVRITQRPGATRDRMRQVLAKLPWPVFEGKNGFSIITEQLYRQVEPLGKTAEKHIPRYAKNWSPRLLNYLLVALLEGDGDANKAYYTSSQKLADDVSEIALKLGYATSVILRPYKTSIIRGRKVSPTGPQWKVNIRGSHLEPWYDPNAYKGVHGGRLNGARGGGAEEWVDFDGEVYCAEVPNHLLIVRRNGKVIVSGNSMAGTSLRQAITALINPTKQAKGIMQELRLEVTDSEGNLKSLTEIVGGLEESGATAADMMALFGQRAGPAMVSLVEQGSEALGDFTANLKDSEGAAKAIAEVNMQGAKGAFLELKSAGEELALSIADSGILGQVTDIAKGTADWLRETSKTNPELLKMGVNLALAAAAAGPLISTTGKITKGVGGIFTLIGKLNPKLGKTAEGLAGAGGAATGAGTKFAALGAAAGPIALATVAAAGLVTAFVILDNNVREKTKSIEQQVEERFTKAAETAIRKSAEMNQAVSDEFQGMSDSVMGKLLDVQIGVAEISEDTYQGIVDEVESMRTRALEQLEQYRSDGLESLHNYYSDLGQLESDEYAEAIANLETHYEQKRGKVETAYDEITTIIAEAMVEGRKVTQEEWDKILDILDGANSEIVDKERLLEGEIAAVNASITDDTKKATKERAKAVIGILEEHHQEELDEIAAQSDKRIEEIVSAYGRGEIATRAELDKQLETAKNHELDLTREAKEGHIERLKDQQWALDATGKVIDEGSGNLLKKWEAGWARIKEENTAQMEDYKERTAEGHFGAAAAAWSSYAQATEEQRPKVLGAAQDVVDGIAEKLGKMEAHGQSSGAALAIGIADGISSKKVAVMSAAKGLADSADMQMRQTLQIASPSKVGMGLGRYFAEGVAIGMGDVALKDASIAMADMMIPAPQSTSSNSITNTVPIYITIQGDVTKDALPKLSDAFSRPVGKILQERGVVGGFR